MLKTMLKATVFASTLALASGAFHAAAFAEVVYNRGSAAEPETVDPHKTSTVYEAHVLRDLFEGLVMQDVKADLIPGAAESWTISDDGTVYTRFVSGTEAEPVLPAVTGFSRTAGCAEIALRLLPAMWEEDPLPVLETLPEAGIEYAYCADRTVFLSDASLPLEDLLEGEGFAYRRAF